MKQLFKNTVAQSRAIMNKIAGKKPEPEQPVPSTPVVITSYSQPHVLQQRMKEANLTHDQKVVADLHTVRMESNFGKMVMYFCPMEKMEVKKQLQPGDGGLIPAEVTVEGLGFPQNKKPGLYNLRNVIVHSNGLMSVTATKETVFEEI